MKKYFLALRNVILGIFESVAFVTMIGAAALLKTTSGTFLILVGLFIGVIGLAIYDLWKI